MEFIKNLSIILACWTAIYGIDAWRREFRGKRNIELAEDALILFYEAQDALRSIRNPFGYGGEGKTRKALENETERQKVARDKAYVLFERYDKYRELFGKLYALRYRFMATFGNDLVEPFDIVHGILAKMFASAQTLSTMWEKDMSHWDEERIEKYDRDQRRHEEIFWWMGDNDPIEAEVKQAIVKIEGICRPVIESRGTLFGILNTPIRNLKKWISS